MDMPGVPAVQAQSAGERRMRGLRVSWHFLVMSRSENELDCRR